jgi:hypothetical protein
MFRVGGGLSPKGGLTGIQRLRDLPLFGSRNDIDQRGHHDAGPECPAEGVQQVSRKLPGMPVTELLGERDTVGCG